MDNFYQILESHRKHCEREGRSTEAELARKRLTELRFNEESQVRSQIKARQQAEKSSLLEAHRMELLSLNQKWESTLPQLEDAAKEAIMKLKEEHKREIEEFKRKREEDIEVVRTHPPTDVLSLRKRLEAVTTQGDLTELKKVRTKLAEAEEAWRGRTHSKLADKFQNLYDKVLERQDREIESLVARLQK